MIIVIDAYNFIKHVSGKSLISDKEIRGWIDTFKKYTRLKTNKVVLVFDAGPYICQSDEIHENVTIIYSGQKQSADDVIKTWLANHRGVDVLVVTSDREIRNFASGIDILSVASDDFYNIFVRVMHCEETYEQKIKHTLHKTTMVESLELDELMEKSSRFLGQGFMSREDLGPIRIRNGKKVSKQDK